MVNKNNILLVDENKDTRFSFDKKNKVVKINKAIIEIDSQAREIIYEEAITALDKYLELLEKMHSSQARKKALEFAESEMRRKYGQDRNWIMRDFNEARYLNEKKYYHFKKIDDYISLGYFKNIVLKKSISGF